MAGDETKEYVVGRSKPVQPASDEKPVEPEMVELNSLEEVPVYEPVPGLFTNPQEEQEHVQKLVGGPPVPGPEPAPPEPELKKEQIEVISKFTKYSEELEQEVEQKISVYYRHQDVRYLTGFIDDIEFEKVSRERNAYRDEKLLEVVSYAKSIGLISDQPDTNPNIKTGTHIDTNPHIESIPSIESNPHVETVKEYLYSSLVPFAGIKRPELIPLFESFFENKLKLLVNATNDQKTEAYLHMKERIPISTGLTPMDVAELRRKAWSVLNPEEPQHNGAVRDNTLPRGIPVLDTLEYRTPPADPTHGDDTPPEVPDHGDDTPPDNPSSDGEGHMAVDLESPQEVYENKVSELLTQVFGLEYMFNVKVKAGWLSDGQLSTFDNQILKFRKQLLELDETADDASQSLDRIELVRLLISLRNRLEKNKNHEPDAGTISIIDDVRNMHQRVRATYASVQHKISIDQRRDMRSQIARFASLVRQAELEDKIAHATQHAPLVAHGALTAKRG